MEKDCLIRCTGRRSCAMAGLDHRFKSCHSASSGKLQTPASSGRRESKPGLQYIHLQRQQFPAFFIPLPCSIDSHEGYCQGSRATPAQQGQPTPTHPVSPRCALSESQLFRGNEPLR